MNAIRIFTITLYLIYTSSILVAQEKMNGVSFVAPSNEIGKAEVLLPKSTINSNYLSIMPYGFIPENGTDLKFNSEWQWWGEKAVGTQKTIQLAKAEGYKIMLKPHVWKKRGSYTGHHTYDNPKDWLAFEKSYSSYILHFAKIAEQGKVDLFCIGTEWEKFALARPNYWFNLIKEVRKIYKGKLTYAANWDEYKRISFWKELDYIGVDAYFPLVNSETPKIPELKKALTPYFKEVKELSEKMDKKIIFTEFGYRSKNNTAEKPWESEREGVVNLKAQENAYQAFFETFWNQNFVAGGFIWKWFTNYEKAGGPEHNGFTPQNKPVESLIKKWYSNINYQLDN